MTHDQLRLMHEVLDGEASADDARELDRLLAADPEARAEYESLRRLFAGLKAMPSAVLPEGMVAETLARIPNRPERRHRLRQLSSRWRVFVSDSTRRRDRSATRGGRTRRDFHGEHNYGNSDMNRRKLWIGLGIAAVAVVAGAYYLDLPPSNDMSGTIAPANRSVAPQPGAADMTADGQGDVLPATVNVTDAASRDAAHDAQRDAAHDAQRDAAHDAQRDAAHDAQRDAAHDAQRDAAHDAQRDAVRDAQRDAVRDAQRDAVHDAQRDAVHDAQRDAAHDAQRDAVRDAQRDAVRDAQRDAVRDASSQQ